MLMLRLHRKAAMVALGAAIVGSITIATPAQAAELGEATVKDNGSWGAGYDACKNKYRNTKSVKLTDADGGWNRDGKMYGTWIWKCYNTPNTT